MASPILDRTKRALAEQAVAFGFKGAIVDRLGLGHFAVRPGTNGIGRGELNANRVEIGRFF